MNLTKPTANLFSNLMVAASKPQPQVGDGATVCYYTDRHAATVIAVKTFKSGARAGQVREVTVQMDRATRTDDLGMSDCQSYSYERDPNGSTATFKVNKQGRFGTPGSSLAIGYREEYYDYSF